MELLVLEGGNQSAGFGEDLNLCRLRETRQRPRLGAFGADDARTNEAVARFGQGDVSRRAPNVAPVP